MFAQASVVAATIVAIATALASGSVGFAVVEMLKKWIKQPRWRKQLRNVACTLIVLGTFASSGLLNGQPWPLIVLLVIAGPLATTAVAQYVHDTRNANDAEEPGWD